MNQTLDYIQQLKDNSSRLKKEAIIKEAWEAGERDLFTAFQLAYNVRKPFFVKKVPKAEDRATLFPREEISMDYFVGKLEMLHKREVTGYDAMELVVGLMEECEVDLWNNLYRNILLKDLRCGTTATTVNKILKKQDCEEADKYITPKFQCQLAEDCNKHEKKMVGEKAVDIKLDGVRFLAFVNVTEKTCVFHTRNGKVNENFPHIEKFLIDTVPDIFKEDMVLDGEITGASFRKLMKQVNRKDDVHTEDVVFHVFDMLTVEEFENGISIIPLWDRQDKLEFYNEWHSLEESNAPVQIVPKYLMDVESQEFKDFMKKAVDDGYEGIMIKDPKSPYECRRTTHWLKMKPFIEVSLEVIGYEEGTGKFKDSLGNLHCKGHDEGKDIEVSVGSGFLEDERKEIWDIKDTNLIGRIVEVRADAITHTQDNDKIFSLRFPRFKGFRGSEVGEKL